MPLYSSTSGATDDSASNDSASKEEPKKYKFDAEVSRVMNIIINSLYSDKSVFLRELISNSADALDKRRFLSLTSQSSETGGIRIKGCKETNTLIIEDDGVGMTELEIIENLGRIANSGTAKFAAAKAEAMKSGSDTGEDDKELNLIGQFGVGFYSGFLVSDKMTVETCSSQSDADAKQWYKWESLQGQDYSITKIDQPAGLDSDNVLQCGTRITLHLKKDALQYAEDFTLKDLVRKYSEFVNSPISVYGSKTEYVKDPKNESKTVPLVKDGFDVLEVSKPLWLRDAKSVNDTEYVDFYKNTFKMNYDTPAERTHFSLEGNVDLKALLFIPGMLPFELSKNMFDEDTGSIRLYVKRVFISDKLDDIIPRYLKFVKGVVDSDDLPLNVGREILQKSSVLSVIRKRLVRKSLDMIKRITAGGGDVQDKFWNNFGKYVKVGVIEDTANMFELAEYCRFQSTLTDEKDKADESNGKSNTWTSLKEYVDNMKEGQEKIYYVTGDSKVAASMSPSIELLKKKGYEVLYMCEPLDEITMQTLGKFKYNRGKDDEKEYALEDAARTRFGEDEDSSREKVKAEERLKDVIKFLNDMMAGKKTDVQISTRLTTSPAAIVQGEYGISPSMQRYMQAQAVSMGEEGGAVAGMLGNMNQRILEINPNHDVVNTLDYMIKSKDEEGAKNYGNLLVDLAGITSGYNIEDPKSFADRLVKLMGMVGSTKGATATVEDAVVEKVDVDVM
jgi:heat shock protein beta